MFNKKHGDLCSLRGNFTLFFLDLPSYLPAYFLMYDVFSFTHL